MTKKVIVIGGGPGGYVAAIRLKKLGHSVLLVEKDRVGGTCLNRGCIPTKALHKSADVFEMMRKSTTYGIDVEGQVTLNFGKVQERKREVVDTLVGGIEQLLAAYGVEVRKGTARFKDAHTVTIQGAEETFDAVILATGSESILPPILGIDTPGVLTSWDLLEMEERPDSLVIVGGGVIGMEFAAIYNAFGTKVTVVEALPSILPSVDGEIVKRYRPMLKKQGIEVHTSALVKEIQEVDGELSLRVETKKGDIRITGEKVLISTGRKPYVEGLGLDEAGIAYSRKGVAVDAHYETNVPNIYAIGDVNGRYFLAHAASAQGDYVAERIAGHPSHIGQHVPGCIFVFPEIAGVGPTEEQLKAQGIAYKSSKFLFGANGKALAMGEGEGVLKVLADESGVLLAAHILGPHASDLIHEALLMVEQGMTVQDIKGIIHAHPTLGEAFYESVLGLKGEAVHMLQKGR